jgi:histidine triad (HIT) family protein
VSENDGVFCNLASGEEESEIAYEEGMMAFHSIGDEAPAHVLVVHRDHVPSLEEMGVAGSGVAFGINNGSDAGQEGFHLHAHVMGSRKMRIA